MNQRLLKIMGFARRKSHGVPLGARKAVTAGVSVAFALTSAASGFFPAAAEAKAHPAAPQVLSSSSTQCTLHSAQGDIEHVIYIQFDNVHFTRDNPNVPSDLEQMPHLLNFFVNNGTFSTNHHTPLIAHTADDIITSLTGVYGERHGQPVSNSFIISTPLIPMASVQRLPRPLHTGPTSSIPSRIPPLACSPHWARTPRHLGSLSLAPDATLAPFPSPTWKSRTPAATSPPSSAPAHPKQPRRPTISARPPGTSSASPFTALRVTPSAPVVTTGPMSCQANLVATLGSAPSTATNTLSQLSLPAV